MLLYYWKVHYTYIYDKLTREVWIEALSAGTQAIQLYGGVTVGMRTLLDALIPATTALQGCTYYYT